MTPVADKTCVECSRPMRIEYEDDPDAAKLSNESRMRILSKWLDIAVRCTQCDSRIEEHQDAIDTKQTTDRLIDESGLPPELRGYRWDQLTQPENAVDGLRKWAEQRQSRGIFLWGNVGVGKTRCAATAAYQRLVVRREPVKWVSVAHLLARLERSYYDSDRVTALQVLLHEGALVLDDLDKAAPTESKLAQLFTAIDIRTEAQSPLIVTCNASPQQLEKRLGAPIASRLVGYSLGRTYHLTGPDRRMRL